MRLNTRSSTLFVLALAAAVLAPPAQAQQPEQKVTPTDSVQTTTLKIDNYTGCDVVVHVVQRNMELVRLRLSEHGSLNKQLMLDKSVPVVLSVTSRNACAQDDTSFEPIVPRATALVAELRPNRWTSIHPSDTP